MVSNAPVAKAGIILLNNASPNGKRGKKGKTVNLVKEPDLSDRFFVGMVISENEQINNPDNVNDVTIEDKWIAPLMINGTVVNMRLDTGEKANLIRVNMSLAFNRSSSLETSCLHVVSNQIKTKYMQYRTCQGPQTKQQPQVCYASWGWSIS